MIPTVDRLASDVLPVRFGEIVNPPAVTNFRGTVQADVDPTSIRARNFPPLFTGDTATGQLYLDGEYVIGTGATVEMIWRPDRIERRVRHADYELTCLTATPPGETAVAQRLIIRNTGRSRETEVRLAVSGWVTRFVGTITGAAPPGGLATARVDRDRRAVVFTDPDTGATSVQGVSPAADRADESSVTVRLRLDAGQQASVDFVEALGETADEALAVYDRIVADVAGALDRAEADWNAELEAIVTPGNDRYSGHLPVLESADEDLQRLYWMGILGVVAFKRETPYSVLGRTYDTLMPRYWPTVTFLWDYSLSSTVHALLDPDVMKRQQAHWMTTDIHTCMGTEWLTGDGLGAWYAVNDYAMTRLMSDYVRWTGDVAWLDERVDRRDGDATRLDEMIAYARNWQDFATPNGLADYGGIGNLLECVSTYIHEVASLNAASVYSLRATAQLLEHRGDGAQASQLRKEADELVARVQELYVEGEGFWNARFPDGRLVPVRHCYDLATALYAIPEDLSPTQRAEMVGFFERELQTPTWMRALSNRDHDAVFSVRADHQWNGAYCAWPSEIAAGLYGIGEGRRASEWLHGLARSANQGPFGQAHFIESVIEPHAGGARKVPAEMPYINDWACSSGGSWTRLVIEGVFGVRAGLDRIDASPDLTGFDPDSRLVGLTWQGVEHIVDRDGVRASG